MSEKRNKVKGGHKLKDYKHIKPSKDEGLVLVGFGKHDLNEVLAWFGTSLELQALKAPLLWPPRWRRESICSQEEKERFVQYTETVRNLKFTDYIAL
jgi:hypothetical protein